MNGEDSVIISEDGEQSSGSKSTREVTSSEESKSNSGLNLIEDSMKRAAAKEKIEKYFYQLIEGCGKRECDNENCFSSGKLHQLSPNEAAGIALKLWKADAQLCDPHPAKIPRTNEDAPSTENQTEFLKVKSQNDTDDLKAFFDSICSGSSSSNKKAYWESPKKSILTAKKLRRIIEKCKSVNNYTQLRSILFEVFSTQEFLAASFKKSDSSEDIQDSSTKEELENVCQDLSETGLPSEEFACKSGPSNTAASDSTSSTSIDIDPTDDSTDIDFPALQESYELLFSVPLIEFENTLVQALVTLSECINLQLRCGSSLINDKLESFINIFLIIFENPTLGSCDSVERALPKICKAIALLPLEAQARIAKIWAKHCKKRLKFILEALQHLITIRTISVHYNKDYMVQDEESITAPTKVMRILFYANILAGDLEPSSLREEDPEVDDANHESIFGVVIPPSTVKPPHDPLADLLQVNVLDCRKPYIPFTEFYNETLSDSIEMDRDFGFYRANEQFSALDNIMKFGLKFSFMLYSFILTPATKTLGLYYDSRIRMYSERRISYLQTVVGQPTNPYLRLKVRRDNIIEDTLLELEMIAMENEKDLKKQLVVEFDGEQGIDEGGVSKEFFQLIVEEIFHPDYGMFCLNEDTEHMWFNRMSFESNAQFALIGIVLGLAIYNNIILDVRFPMVVYKKLMGKRGSFFDLEDFNPSLFNGLKDLLDYEGDDISEVFVQTFRICYKDPFGSVVFHDLKPDGDNILVDQDNKIEFVALYSDFLLNSSVKEQFKAFRRGFQMVTDESPLSLLFRPEEIEQLVCGSKIFNLNDLEEATDYDGGYTAETPIIRQFWEIVHAMPEEQQKKLIQFTTGSDRIPVGGLSKLKMFIARIGPDSDRLPTAHTCFNVLLLPEYNSKEKLYERLMKAITYSQGFGML